MSPFHWFGCSVTNQANKKINNKNEFMNKWVDKQIFIKVPEGR